MSYEVVQLIHMEPDGKIKVAIHFLKQPLALPAFELFDQLAQQVALHLCLCTRLKLFFPDCACAQLMLHVGRMPLFREGSYLFCLLPLVRCSAEATKIASTLPAHARGAIEQRMRVLPRSCLVCASTLKVCLQKGL